MDQQEGAGGEACPHINLNDNRCGSRFCLGRLDQAFSVCLGSFHGCPMYHRINHEIAVHDRSAKHPLVALTTHGGSVTLRATGS